MPLRTMAVLVLCAGAVLQAAQRAASPSARPRAGALDDAMREYWQADDAEGRAKAARRIAAAKPPFEEVRGRLSVGRVYGPAASGGVPFPSRVAGLPLDNVLEVPAGYVPTRRWPLRVSLHGGVGRDAPGDGATARPLTNRTPLDGELVLHPRAWAGAEWWTPGQVDNVARLVDRVKRQYNVDETRTYLTGISDGGTGTYYFAMRAATAWAACIPLNGHPMVLTNPAVGDHEQFYAGNLVNCPLHVVNGGRDPLYPAASVEPLVRMLRDGRVPVSFQVYPAAGHNVNWWPEEQARVSAFLEAHPRQAHPVSVSWEADRTDRFNRFRWLVVERLGGRPGEAPLPDVNTFYARSRRAEALYARERPSGRVDAVRSGNAFDVRTRGVARFTLLLSPDVIDFAMPVRVTVNGHVVHEARVTPSLETLLAWAARDDDRTMVYGAALAIDVP